MSYLKLIDDKIQSYAESISSELNVEVTVVDDNLLRIAGTGDFYNRINESSPENSLFAKVLKSKKKELTIFDKDYNNCEPCNFKDTCKERKSIIYPIMIEKVIVGVVCFASFNLSQDQQILNEKERYIKVLTRFAEDIENEIISIKMLNSLNMGISEINGIINYINRCIIIVNSDKKIIHINSKAIKFLNINLSINKVINKKIDAIIKNFKVEDTNNKELIGNWEIENKTFKVVYKVSLIALDKENISTLIDFETLDEIINIAMSYNIDNATTFENIIGYSESMLDVIEKAKIAAKYNSTILLNGESGTGKELFAKSIHNASIRRDGPFIAVNCATLPENLVESELFGYEKGSFTGASPKGKIGKFEQANGGTLFLDEIGDFPLHLQGKLLRVLQEGNIDRIGGSAPININVRIISATHRNLEEMIKTNQFREDLFYRINVIPLHLPPLRARDRDVILCSKYIIKKLCMKMNKPEKHISKDVETKFLSYSWHGNVRELENVLEYALNFSNYDEIGVENLPAYFLNNNVINVDNGENFIEIDNLDNLDKATRQYEKMILKKLLDMYGDTMEGKSKITKQLDISLTTLYRKLNDY